MASNRDSRDPSQRREGRRSWLEDAPWTRRRDEDEHARELSGRQQQHEGGPPREAYRQGGHGAFGQDHGGPGRNAPRGARGQRGDHVDRDFSVRESFREREYLPGWQGDDRFYTGVFGGGAGPDFRSGPGGEYEVEDWGYQMGWNPDEPRRHARGGDGATGAGARGWSQAEGSRTGSEDRSHAFAQPRQGGFRGLGPKNYTRPDQRITEDLCERLTEDDRIDAREIEVRVSEGVVTLSGTVADRAMKHRAEDLAERCTGVRDVDNRIRVAREDGRPGDHAGRGP